MDISYLGTKRTIGRRGAHSVRGDLEGRWGLKASLTCSGRRILDAEETPEELALEATEDACTRRRDVG